MKAWEEQDWSRGAVLSMRHRNRVSRGPQPPWRAAKLMKQERAEGSEENQETRCRGSQGKRNFEKPYF